MAEISLTIHGQSYGMACDDGQEERVRALGQYVDQRLREIASVGAATNEAHLLVLASLMLTDEIFEMREQLAVMQQRLQAAESQAQQQNVAQPVAPAAPAPVVQGLSESDEQAAVDMIAQLIGRIDQVTDRLAAA